ASPFTFQLTQGDAPDYTLSITGSQSPNCSPLPAITGGALCVFTPVCPVFADNASCPANSSTPCPGSNLSFGLSTTLSTNLPNGGTVEWVNDKDNDGDVYDEAASAVIATQSISTSHAPQACGDLSAGEIAFVNISTSSSTEQFCFVNLVPLAAGTQIKFIDASWSSTASSFNSSEGGLITWTAPAATVPIGSIVCISNSTGTVSIVSGVGTVAHSSWGTGSFALNNNGDQIFAFCGTSPTSTGAIPSGMTLLAGINADADSWAYKSDQPSESSDLPPGLINGQSAIAIGDGPPSPSSSVGDVNVGNFNCTGGTLSGSMSALSMAINTVGNWTVTPDAGTAATPSACTITNTVVPNVPPPIVTLTPACATYTVPVEACNTTLRIKPRISPDQTGCAPGTPTPTLPTETFVVTCPTATISGEAAICSGNAASLPIVLANAPPACTQVSGTYAIDGSGSIAFGPLTISGNMATLTGLTTPGVITLNSLSFSGAGCNACTASLSGSFTLTISTNPADPLAVDAAVCTGQASVISATGSPDLIWYSDMAGTMVIGGGSSIVVNETGPLTVYVQSVNPDNGCKSGIVSVPLTFNAPPTAIADDNNVCVGSPLALAGTGTSVAPATVAAYVWSTTSSNGFTSTQEDPQVTATAALADAGTYTLYVEDSNGCYDTDDALITVTPQPTPSAAGMDQSVCLSSSS
ncbi:MAG TPA: hypothetical protein PKD78_02205, partial [Saprospiraceae bacterium]|nr:hypothetical protein [Saprospiraceae bacterium]